MEAATDTEIERRPPWTTIVVAGPESTAFLQGQLSQDLASVSPSGAWSLLLAPDGIVITSIHVVPNSEGYTLSVPHDLGEVALARLKRFLLRTKCTLELTDNVLDGFNDTVEAQIEAGRPGSAEFSRNLTPQCFGSTFVASTVSFTKGCFTGQELVGRLDARGSSVPWRLVRVSGPSEERLNVVLTSKGPAGTSGVTTALRRGERIIGLGFAHRSLLGSAELQGAPDVTVEEIA